MRGYGLAHIPSNDFSLYDHVLDMAVAVGAVPQRFRVIADPLDRYFAMARGFQHPATGVDIPALEMTKWFDTNYHYIVPEMEPGQKFVLADEKILGEVREARAMGIETRPVLVGPLTLLLLSKGGEKGGFGPLELLEDLLPVYEENQAKVRLFVRGSWYANAAYTKALDAMFTPLTREDAASSWAQSKVHTAKNLRTPLMALSTASARSSSSIAPMIALERSETRIDQMIIPRHVTERGEPGSALRSSRGRLGAGRGRWHGPETGRQP